MRYRQAFIAGRSSVGTDIGSIATGDFDLGLLAASWDRRSGCVATAPGLHLRHTILLTFASRDPLDIQKKNEDILRSFLQRTDSSICPVSGVGEDVEREWARIWDATKGVLGHRTNQRIFVDLTGCPRFYSLGLIAALFSTGMAAEVSVLYAEGHYHSEPYAAQREDVPFSIGHWRNLPIPFLEGRAAPTNRKYYLVSVGFEASKTARVLSAGEPDRISMLYPIPGVRPEYERETTERNAEIRERFRVPQEQVINAEASDAIAAWRSLDRAHLENALTEDVYYLCCGSKPHSLALALRGLCLGHPTVLYNRPERHNFVEVSPTGRYWLYQIRDVSSPVANP